MEHTNIQSSLKQMEPLPKYHQLQQIGVTSNVSMSDSEGTCEIGSLTSDLIPQEQIILFTSLIVIPYTLPF